MAFHFENKINSTIDRYGMINPSDTILIAVSGGADSMCLAHVLFALQFKIAVAHVNYKLRGVESDLDENLINRWCMDRKIPFHSTSFDTPSISLESKKGIQETARVLRYDWFDRLAKEFHYDKIATGHHLDDQAETVLHNLIRGAGLQGAKGIPLQNGILIRPLIFVSKKEILSYVLENSIPYREDLSNLKTQYTRNQIRHQILPPMNAINPKASRHIAQFGLRIQSILPGYHLWKKTQIEKYITKAERGFRLITPDLIDWGLLYVLLEDFGFNESQIGQLHLTIQNKEKGKIFLSPAYKLYYTGDFLDIQKIPTVSAEVNIQIEHLPFKVTIGKLQFEFTWLDASVSNAGINQLDLTNYSLPLTLRTWMPGDRFAPYGMNGNTKKVQDYLTDLKLSGIDKKQALVLLSKGEIIWVWPGGRISESVKVTTRTPSIMNIVLLQAKAIDL